MSEEELNKWRKKTKGIYHIVRYNQFWNYIDNLRDISKDREEYEYGLEQHLEELHQRIDQAIEYIENNSLYYENYDYNEEEELELKYVYDDKVRNDLLEILGDKEKDIEFDVLKALNTDLPDDVEMG